MWVLNKVLNVLKAKILAERLFWGNTGNENVLGNLFFSFYTLSTSLGHITTSNIFFYVEYSQICIFNPVDPIAYFYVDLASPEDF